MNRRSLINTLDELVTEIDRQDIKTRFEGGLNWASVTLTALKGALENVAEQQLADVVHDHFIVPRLPGKFNEKNN